MATFTMSINVFDIDELRSNPEKAVRMAVMECALQTIKNRNMRSAVSRLNRASKETNNSYMKGMYEIELVAAKNTVFEMFLTLVQNGKYAPRAFEAIESEYAAYKTALTEKRRAAAAKALEAKKAKRKATQRLIEDAEQTIQAACSSSPEQEPMAA